MQRLGCSQSTVGLVIPTGFSFNLDGTNIYMAMAAVFLAQATNTPLSLGHQISLLLVAMLTSKGASGVSGAGFITLAATLSIELPGIPLATHLRFWSASIGFMSQCQKPADEPGGKRSGDSGHQPLGEGVDGRDAERKSLPSFSY